MALGKRLRQKREIAVRTRVVVAGAERAIENAGKKGSFFVPH